MSLGTIKDLYRYPVKSLRGERCSSLQLEQRGVKGDRSFAITDSKGRPGSGKNTRRFTKIKGLLSLKAHYLDGQPMITFTDGQVVAGNAPNINTLLSNTLGQPVQLEMEKKVSHLDLGPIHIITTASTNWLKSKLPNAEINESRFRPNIVLDTDGDAFVELEWVGKIIQLGDVQLKIVAPVERCIMTTLVQGNLPSNPEILKFITQELGLHFGVYAKVIKSGNVYQEDEFTL